MIILWHGSVATIPTGWNLCDGSNGTPDLRNRFVIGAGSTYNPAATGGGTTHAHVIDINEHDHAMMPGSGIAAGDGYGTNTDVTTPGSTVQNANHLPPYFALCYIMKL
jgi:hypothetical protein